MVKITDATIAQKIVLSQQVVCGVKLTTGTGSANYKMLQKIQDDTVTITPDGGDPQVFEALDGTTYDVPQKIKSIKVGLAVWLAPNDLTLLRTSFGEPVVTGSAPYVNTFTLDTMGQDVDFYAQGYSYGSAVEYVKFTGSAGSMKFTSLEIQKGGKLLFKCEGVFSPSNCQKIIASSTNLGAI